MRIIQLTYHLASGGGERFLVDLSNELCLENEVIVIQILSNDNLANSHYLPDLDNRIKYINLNCSSGLSFEVFRKVSRTIATLKPDVVHVHCALLTIVLAALLYNKPAYFHTLHSSAERCLGSKRKKFLYRYMYKHLVQAITISKTCQESYEDLYHLDNGVCITNGRSQVLSTNELQCVYDEVNSLKLHEDDKLFLHIARYHPIKNQKLLFQTFERLVNENEHVQLIVIGNGFADSPLASYKDSRCIHLLGEKRNIGDYLTVCDYFILSSRMEGLPISLLEAMSIGVIPVSTPAGGVCDVIRNAENGYISETHNPIDFYNTVKRALKNADKISSQAIIQEYKDKYSMPACAKLYLEQFNK